MVKSPKVSRQDPLDGAVKSGAVAKTVKAGTTTRCLLKCQLERGVRSTGCEQHEAGSKCYRETRLFILIFSNSNRVTNAPQILMSQQLCTLFAKSMTAVSA